jgi:dolichyl-phosphate-mannose--protein O-mannosyl transferase
LCNCNIATNFGVVVGEVILVDSCAIIFICCDCYLFFREKKKEKQNFCLLRYCSFTAAVLFKTIFLVELGPSLLFPKEKQHFEQD